MKLRIKSALISAVILVAAGCDDLIERSLKNDVVVVISPSDGTISQNYTQTFFWEELKGATQYRLQVVYNKFDSAAQFRLDSIITKNKLTTTLRPSRYQWRVEAINASSRTENKPIQNLRIDSVSIEGQDILLLSPGQNYATSNPEVTFKWDPLPGATEYRMELYKEAGTVMLDTIIRMETQLKYSFAVDGNYRWKVTGKRGKYLSNASENRICTIDRVAPGVVILQTPGNNATASNPATLTWTSPATDIGYFEIYIYKTNETTPFSSKYNPYSTQKDAVPAKLSFVFSEGKSGDKIFWKVIAVDRAGNRSTADKTNAFTIQ